MKFKNQCKGALYVQSAGKAVGHKETIETEMSDEIKTLIKDGKLSIVTETEKVKEKIEIKQEVKIEPKPEMKKVKKNKYYSENENIENNMEE